MLARKFDTTSKSPKNTHPKNSHKSFIMALFLKSELASCKMGVSHINNWFERNATHFARLSADDAISVFGISSDAKNENLHSPNDVKSYSRNELKGKVLALSKGREIIAKQLRRKRVEEQALEVKIDGI
eukprot:TRINITY_DN16574_c0_g1_i1.p1 TRINITY_DN16574_c0_g1~~TRINITY_DN16574_c0_g1_i1.p1  ORF type:complete len:129 (-),score=17.91 TRINITY_DN16574_c0_g1_i1:172-558(-)